MRFAGLMLSALCCVLGAACSGVRTSEDLADYAGTVGRLEERLRRSPEDAEALRTLGVIYVRTGHAPEALPYLERAHAADTSDARTLFYLGVAAEGAGRTAEAMRVYGRYAGLPAFSPFRRLLEGRYRLLARQAARDEIRALLAGESGRDATAAAPGDVVAVFPLVYQGTDARYAPLGRGLSEMLTVDLATAGGLRVVERVRLQALLDELALAESGFVDPASAPRMGRLLGAGRVVGGTYTVLDGSTLRLDPAVVSLEAPDAPRLPSTSGAMRDLFRLEKELAFRLLDELDVALTPEERARIEHVPTENLQAFFAYCRGLQEEDAGRYEAAAGFFRQAAALDPGFAPAAERAEATATLSTAAGPPEQAVAAAAGLDRAPLETPSLLDLRQQQLGTSVGAHFVPGQDGRAPVSEAAASDPEGGGLSSPGLPDPPRPPDRN